MNNMRVLYANKNLNKTVDERIHSSIHWSKHDTCFYDMTHVSTPIHWRTYNRTVNSKKREFKLINPGHPNTTRIKSLVGVIPQ